MMSGLGVIACALVLEAVAGYPEAWVRAIGHPVMWVGALIARLDRAWNDEALNAATRRQPRLRPKDPAPRGSSLPPGAPR